MECAPFVGCFFAVPVSQLVAEPCFHEIPESSFLLVGQTRFVQIQFPLDAP